MTVKLEQVTHYCTQEDCGEEVIGTVGAAVKVTKAYVLKAEDGTLLYWGRALRGRTQKENTLDFAVRKGWTVIDA